MANEVDDSVIRKIQKLLEMAARTAGNEAEAAVALGKAQDLMAQYNLSQATIEDTQVAGGVEREAVRAKTKINRSAMYDWQKTLWSTLASSNFCWHFIIRVSEPAGRDRATEQMKYRTVKRHQIIGREDNVKMVEMMGEYLCDTIERLLPFTNNKDRLSREAISWRAGCAYRLEERLRDQRRERIRKSAEVTQNSTETGLSIIDVETKEYASNYDFLYGVGSYARALARQAEDKAKAELAESKPETMAEMEARKKSEAKWAKQWEREQREQARKYNRSSFSAGYVKGGDIGLNSQISTKETPALK